jgi:hypothetical protein
MSRAQGNELGFSGDRNDRIDATVQLRTCDRRAARIPLSD